VRLNPFTGRLSNVVYAGSPAEVEHVFVGGEAVVQNGRSTRWDEDEVVEMVNRTMATVLQRAGMSHEWPVSKWQVI
jgi:5-methylthioadenosine/S-adenosylhomocysteine deaminase